ncbi:MAG: hypothetical protein ACLSHO_08670 [Dysosmobacter sp.]
MTKADIDAAAAGSGEKPGRQPAGVRRRRAPARRRCWWSGCSAM